MAWSARDKQVAAALAAVSLLPLLYTQLWFDRQPKPVVQQSFTSTEVKQTQRYMLGGGSFVETTTVDRASANTWER